MGEQYCNLKQEEVFKKLSSSENGLENLEAKKRIKEHGFNEIPEKDKKNIFTLFLSQFKSPFTLILFGASVIAFFLKQVLESMIILVIIILNSLLAFYQEYRSERALKKLKKYISFNAKVLREGQKIEISVKELVPGDIVFFGTGDIIPADVRLLESNDLSLNESALTGESFPVRKTVNVLDKENIPISEQTNMLFMGSVVSAGLGRGVVVSTGKNTEFGKTAVILSAKFPPTDFEKGIKNFGNFLIKVVFSLTLFVFLINSLLGKGVFDSFLFALALAVGITPELLPLIITISLSNGAMKMAKKNVIVKKLASIENFGNMNVLCVDKTGTLTENKMTLHDYFDYSGKKSKELLDYSILCNSAIEHNKKYFGNIIDISILEYADKEKISVMDFERLQEIEFDYERRMMSYIVKGKEKLMITKGSPLSVLDICTYLERNKRVVLIKDYKLKLEKQFQDLSKKGFRVIALAYKRIRLGKKYTKEDEQDMVFLGFITFLDPPKKNIKQSLEKLEALSIELKVLTGDNEFVTQTVCKEVGIKIKDRIILGEELSNLTDNEFFDVVRDHNVFARITPEQKFKIVESLNKKNYVVGFLGDGVNDAPALRAADVGISVDTAVDVAKESSDIILLQKNLDVLVDGIYEGRKTFGNSIKYILITISSNFGNMFSLSLSSAYFKFIPMLPSQVLLLNFYSDVSFTSISSDNVDEEYLRKPKKWNMKFIYKFMIFFGLISSIFDLLTMALVWFLLAPKNIQMFRTVWFFESILSEVLVILVIRTRKSIFKSKPGKFLVGTLCLGILLALASIYLAFSANIFQFGKLSLWMVGAIVLVLVFYLFLAEIGKKIFYKMAKEE